MAADRRLNGKVPKSIVSSFFSLLNRYKVMAKSPQTDSRNLPTGAGSAALAEESRDRRVRIVIQVVNDPYELEEVVSALRSRGWQVRRADAADQINRDLIWLVVDVRLSGAQRNAVKAAADLIDNLAANKALGMQVHTARSIRYPHGAWITHYQRSGKESADPSNFFGRWLNRLIGSEIVELTRTPDRKLPGTHVLRPDAQASHEAATSELVRGSKLSTMVGAGAVAFASGAAVLWLSSYWRAVAGAAALIAAWPLSTPLPNHVQPHPALRFGRGITAAASAFLIGLALEKSAPRSGGKAWLSLMVLAVVVILSAIGTWLALRRSWFSRNSSLTTTLILSAVSATMPWVGRTRYDEYLAEFGIPSGAVSTSTFWNLYSAAAPVSIATVFILFFVGIVGWMRYFYLLRGVLRSIISCGVVAGRFQVVIATPDRI